MKETTNNTHENNPVAATKKSWHMPTLEPIDYSATQAASGTPSPYWDGSGYYS